MECEINLKDFMQALNLCKHTFVNNNYATAIVVSRARYCFNFHGAFDFMLKFTVHRTL